MKMEVKDLLHLADRKGISLMISYVLLIVLAVGIATGVYSFLKFYLPSDDTKECPDDIGLIITEASCTEGKLNINLQNRGFFNIDGAYIKIGEINRVVKETMCFEMSGGECKILLNGQTILGEGGEQAVGVDGLKPGETVVSSFIYTKTGDKEIEVEPVVFVQDELIACKKVIVRKIVSCE